MNIHRLKILLTMLLFSTLTAYAELEIVSYQADLSDYPQITCNITVEKDGGVPPANSINAVLIEGARTATPDELQNLGGGKYTFTFTTSTYNFDDVSDKFRYSNSLVVYDKSETAFANITRVLNPSPRVFFTDQDSRFFSAIKYGVYYPPYVIPFQIRFGGYLNNFNSEETALAVDTITTETDIFKIKWLGQDGNTSLFKGFPTYIQPLDRHWANLYYTPVDSNAYYHDMLTLHFNGGNKLKIPIYAGVKKINKDTVLELISPKGGEILTPCEKIELKWRGHNKDVEVQLHFSNDDGETWREITRLKDSVYLWTVPSDISKNARIKVFQDAFQSERRALKNTDDPVYDVSYNDFGTELLSINNIGVVAEWDLFSDSEPTILNKYYFDKSASRTYSSTAVNYSNGRDIIAASYYSSGDGSYVHFFNKGEESAFKIYKTPENYIVQELQTDVNDEYLALVPQTNAKLILLDPLTGELKKEVDFDYPILNLEFNTKLERVAVVLLNGDFLILNSTDFSEINRFRMYDFKMITAMDYSANGEMLALSVHSEDNSATSNYIVDVTNGDIIRDYPQAALSSSQIGFSPSSGSLVIAAPIGKQLSFYDLTNESPHEDLAGHFGNVTDFAISPDGHSMVSSADSRDNLFLRTFAFPEGVISNSFEIEPAQLSTEEVVLSAAYIGTEQTININNACNIGDAMIDIRENFVVHGRNFSLADPSKRDTLYPGECSDLNIIYMPVDTGRVTDSLAFRVCGIDIMVPLVGEGLPRNFSYSADTPDFGEVCIGDTAVIRNFEIRNEDPAPMKINQIQILDDEGNNFFAVPFITDTIIPAHSSLMIDLKFVPDKVGLAGATLQILHSNQDIMIEELTIQGFGIGAEVEVSHEQLLFIPELLQRELEITNKTNVAINISELVPIPAGNFENITVLPVTIPAQETRSFTISWDGNIPAEEVLLKIEANPCLIQKYIQLGLYSGSSAISVNDTAVGPLDEAAIRISYTNQENGSYDGIRPFEGVFTMNPRLFLPTDVESPFGEGEITRNEVIGDKRYIGFRINGDFDEAGDLAFIKGIPGLAETSTTEVRFEENEIAWGESVSTSYGYGTFTVADSCADRSILRSSNALNMISISPNPANDVIKLEFTSEIEGVGRIEIFAPTGKKVLSSGPYNIRIGNNSCFVNIQGLSPGNYKVQLKLDGQMTQEPIMIMR